VRPFATAMLVAALAVILAACGGEAAAPEPAARDLFGYPVHRDETSGIDAILGTPDLGVGRHRVAFVLTDAEGIVRLPVVQARSYFYPDGPESNPSGSVESGQARFFEFPFGSRGIYSLDLAFDRPGTWGLEVDVPRPDGSVATVAFTFPVADETTAPAVGDPAPASRNRTAADVGSLAELTTGSAPDPAVYEKSVAQALEEGRPFVLVFASPAFCTNPLCGPQVEMLSELHPEYGDRIDFIHIDIYDNPHEIQGDLGHAVRSPILEQWGIETDEWTFVVDAEGRVAARFESFVPREELEPALRAVLRDPAASSR
jgi:hypothetical protein